mgnify:CR=1 FL=1
MRLLKTVLVIVIGVILVTSCGREEKQGLNQNEVKDENRTSYRTIGTVINNVPVLTADENSLVKSWNDFLEENGIDETITTVRIEKINDTYYVVALGNGVKSVRSLIIDEDLNAIIDYKVTCTTTDCSATPKCFPQGNTCVPCDKPEHKCTKIISSGEM